MARIRQFKQEFFQDKVLAGLDDSVRLFFVGLWTEADDDGYLKWEPDQIAARFYPYWSMKKREGFVRKAVDALAKTGHLRILDCGVHVTVPNLPKHQVVASTRRVVRTHGEHNAQCVNNGAQWSAIEIQEGTVGKGKVGKGTETHMSERTDTRTDGHAHASDVDRLQALLLDPNSTEPAKKAARKALDRLGIA